MNSSEVPMSSPGRTIIPFSILALGVFSTGCSVLSTSSSTSAVSSITSSVAPVSSSVVSISSSFASTSSPSSIFSSNSLSSLLNLPGFPSPFTSFLLPVAFFLLILIIIPLSFLYSVYLCFYDLYFLRMESESPFYWKIDRSIVRYKCRTYEFFYELLASGVVYGINHAA
ncbi:Uncharacterised protein [uncultured archaeon]|nr:Uncharacterised protein [uncultured archaeon]